ncbi:alpha-2A adrenergic receptor-like [Gigantopelta aegis]|uniref:alpha-2A adrenergic receptor-like n=1 Tax=Gigantopelta aegis TaxID=1735272 RepID=UPI001B889F45|nr:alpha-2A adrenergic receptor-like [Gigantopelta aegis]
MDSDNKTSSIVSPAVLGMTMATCAIAFVVIVGGNILTLLAIWRTESLRTHSNMYVVSLAVSDLITGALIPTGVSILQGVSDLHYNKYLCLSQIVLTSSIAGVSVVTMTLIALDRYLYIKYPMKYTMVVSGRKVKIVIGLAWVVTFLLNSFMFFVNNWSAKGGCFVLKTAPSTFRAGFIFLYVIIGCVLCIFFYGSISLVARRQQKAITSAAAHNTPAVTRASWRLVKLFLVVFGIFFICWIPISVTYIFEAFVQVPLVVSYVVTPLVYVNAAANCFVYGWFNRDFRRAYKGILGYFCNCCK